MQDEIGDNGVTPGLFESLKEIPGEPLIVRVFGLLLKIEPRHLPFRRQFSGQFPRPGTQFNHFGTRTFLQKPAFVPHQEIDEAEIATAPQRPGILRREGIEQLGDDLAFHNPLIRPLSRWSRRARVIITPPMTSAAEKASVLIKALPYLQRFRGKTFLIKMGGSAMDHPELVRDVMRDIVFLEVAGIKPIIVHGGGKAISAAMIAAGLEARFVGGLRVTTPEAIEIVDRTLHGEINKGLVETINEFGGKATSIHGTSVFSAKQLFGKDEDGNEIDIGRVGQVTNCRSEEILDALSEGIVPVISPLGRHEDSGDTHNINADIAAAALACALKPAKLVYLSDVPGLLRDAKDETTLIESVTGAQARGLIADGTISGGMIPKIESALEALESGVEKVHFIDGRMSHTLLLEIFTRSGIGTEIRTTPRAENRQGVSERSS